MKLFRAGVRPEQLALTTRHLATLVGSGILITEALSSLSETTPDEALAEVLDDLSHRIRQGYSLSQALGRHTEVFPPLYISLIKVGENTGGLAVALDALAGWMQRDYELKSTVRAALIYPTFVLGLVGLLTWVFATNVIPRFEAILTDLHAELPWPTRVLLAASRVMSHPITWILVVTVVLNGLAFVRTLRHRPEVRRRVWLVGSYIPVVGKLLRLTALARYCSAAAILLRSGVNLLASVKLSAEASDSPFLQQDLERIVRNMKLGEPLAALMSQGSNYPPAMAQMVKVGEETSRLPDMFGNIGRLYQDEVNHQIEVLKAVMEPVLLGLVSGLVGLVVVALLVPLYSVVSQLG